MLSAANQKFVNTLEEKGGDIDLDKYKGITFTDKNYATFELLWSTEELPYCCGIDELGGFCIEEETDRISKRRITSIATDLLKELAKDYHEGNSPYSKKCTKRILMINLVPDDCEACKIVEVALKRLKKYYKKINTFVNSNTNNKVITYISK